jgi:hypothetical protein
LDFWAASECQQFVERHPLIKRVQQLRQGDLGLGVVHREEEHTGNNRISASHGGINNRLTQTRYHIQPHICHVLTNSYTPNERNGHAEDLRSHPAHILAEGRSAGLPLDHDTGGTGRGGSHLRCAVLGTIFAGLTLAAAAGFLHLLLFAMQYDIIKYIYRDILMMNRHREGSILAHINM